MKRILIVDDNRMNIAFAKGCLGDMYEMLSANSGEEAVDILSRQRFDLVLLDYVMPGLNGMGVLKFIRGNINLREMPVVMVTSSEEMEVACLDAGAQDFVKKPYAPEVLKMRVARTLEMDDYHRKLSLLVQQKSKRIEKMQTSIIANIANLIENRDKDSGQHVKRVGFYMGIIADRLRKMPDYQDLLNERLIRNMMQASALHDVGKISISDNILCKPAKLTAQEYEVMKTHTVLGARIIRQCLENIEEDDYTEMAEQIALYHHERWDGTGYPEGLSGTSIPLCARIMSVADVFDALISRRCYKEIQSMEEAFRIIGEGAGTEFEPAVVDAFLAEADSIGAIVERMQR